ncbi:AMP-binding enzyme [Tianweitania sediminis]|jgi:acyl-coenzyme A synthetase/AMP-(fatty) acid ligase|uniref:AMP-binding enzyme n=1 Tax=Tianweitania sediminis TaxID=1502156 RepID=UPI001FD871FE|nr:hypothetical protein [Tianweitania sediminis]HEV7416668.1 hypothetical protein [Tianweitania sediminis]
MTEPAIRHEVHFGRVVRCIEVESTLSYHPDVVEAAVIGKPDPVLEEKVHAFI